MLSLQTFEKSFRIDHFLKTDFARNTEKFYESGHKLDSLVKISLHLT